MKFYQNSILLLIIVALAEERTDYSDLPLLQYHICIEISNHYLLYMYES